MKPAEGDVTWPLSRMVEEEARRVLSEAELTADPALVAEGWERRFVTDGRRATEVIDLYERGTGIRGPRRAGAAGRTRERL
jgi:hypothetical protein